MMLRFLFTAILALSTTTQAWWFKDVINHVKDKITSNPWVQKYIDGCIDLYQSKVSYWKDAIADCKVQLEGHYGDASYPYIENIVEKIKEYEYDIDDCLDHASEDLDAAIEKLKEFKEQIKASIQECLSLYGGYGDHGEADCLEGKDHGEGGMCGVTPGVASNWGVSIYDTIGESDCTQCFNDPGHKDKIKKAIEICLAYCILCAKCIFWIACLCLYANTFPAYAPEHSTDGIEIMISQSTLTWALVFLLVCGLAMLGMRAVRKTQTYKPLKLEAESEDELL